MLHAFMMRGTFMMMVAKCKMLISRHNKYYNLNFKFYNITSLVATKRKHTHTHIQPHINMQKHAYKNFTDWQI